jgi:hypothetical protein
MQRLQLEAPFGTFAWGCCGYFAYGIIATIFWFTNHKIAANLNIELALIPSDTHVPSYMRGATVIWIIEVRGPSAKMVPSQD